MALQRECPNIIFGAGSRRAPAVKALRHSSLAHGRNDDLETTFRHHVHGLSTNSAPEMLRTVTLDGKSLCSNFDHLTDHRAVHVLSAFARDAVLVLAQQELAGAPDAVANVP